MDAYLQTSKVAASVGGLFVMARSTDCHFALIAINQRVDLQTLPFNDVLLATHQFRKRSSLVAADPTARMEVVEQRQNSTGNFVYRVALRLNLRR